MPVPEPPPLGTAMLPPGTFAGEVVAVTGGGTGLGKAIAVEFARLGAAVAIVSRGADHRARGVEAVESAGGRAIGVEMDVREPDQVARAFDVIEGQLGPVGVIVNNAAGNFPVAAEELSPNGWKSVTDIVLNGTFICSREFALRRIAASAPGAILNIGATYAWTGGPGAAHSAAAKAGVVNMTLTLAVEWAPYGIRVNCLCPGLFPHEDMPAHMTANRPEGYAEAGTTIPAGRVGRPHELGWAATYLCSPFATYLTGHTLVLDGANWQRRGLKMPVVVPVRDQVPRRPPKAR
ncbi:MAG TPA: SDR family oxidoreductase [Candidatus Eisenbacteria bacterium]|nr:SDR family oxidoreductase [Candidatus Eisenbacteria bacterium]